MEVLIKYKDNTSFTIEEIVHQAKTNYGINARVEVRADTSAPTDQIYFGIQQLLTHKQLGLLYNNKDTYATDIGILRKQILSTLAELLDTAIIENETKVQ